jgi:hypothetical protein
MIDPSQQFAPAQIGNREPGRIPWKVHIMAYEVYCKVFGPQQALVQSGCRGGFGVGELIGFLYARNFPKAEWDARFHEAIRGLESR